VREQLTQVLLCVSNECSVVAHGSHFGKRQEPLIAAANPTGLAQEPTGAMGLNLGRSTV